MGNRILTWRERSERYWPTKPDCGYLKSESNLMRCMQEEIDELRDVIPALEAQLKTASDMVAPLNARMAMSLKAITALEADAVQWQQSRDWFALKCVALRDKLKQFNVEDEEIMEVTRRARSALGDQHE